MIEGPHAVLMQIVYTFGNLVGIALALYKCQTMGLLPTHPSDWLAFVEPQAVSITQYTNFSYIYHKTFYMTTEHAIKNTKSTLFTLKTKHVKMV